MNSDQYPELTLLYLSKDYGGGGVYVHRLSSALSSEGIKHKLDTFFNHFGDLDQFPCTVVRVRRRGILSWIEIIATLVKSAYSGATTIIACDHVSLRAAVVSRIFAPKLKIGYLLQCSLDLRNSRLRKFVRKMFYAHLWAVAANSTATLKSILPIAPQNIKAGVIYYGLDEAEKDTPSPLPTTKTILLPGRMLDGKGHKDLLIASLNQGWNVVMAGDGPLMPWIMNEVRNRTDIKILGWVDKLRDVYLQSTVVVLPSRSEGFGLVLLEAMSIGRPVVCYDNGPTSEIVENGKTGIIVPNGNIEMLRSAVNGLLNDLPETYHMAKMAYKSVWERFTLKAMARQMMDVFGKEY